MANYYLSNNGSERIGPIPEKELIRNGMTPNSLVWCKSMPGWKRAGEVPELAKYFVAQSQPQYQSQPQQGPYYQQDQYAFDPNSKFDYNQPQYLGMEPKPSFGEAVTSCFANFANFKGRARRSEFWWFFLFNVLLGFALSFIPFNHVSDIVSLACFIPLLAVSTRRLHDTGHSGWWLFFFYLGFLLLVVVSSFAVYDLGYSYSSYDDYYHAVRSLSSYSLGLYSIATMVLSLYVLVMGIILLVFYCTDSDKLDNKYGPSPKYKYGNLSY